MEYAAPEGPFALPLWHHGRMFLVPTSDWVLIKTQNGKEFRTPQCGSSQAQVMVMAAKAARSIWAKTNFSCRQNMLCKLAESLAQLSGHFAELFPVTFPNATDDIHNAVAILKNRPEQKIGKSQKILAFLPARSMPLTKFAQFLSDCVLNADVTIVKPIAEFSALFLALAELSAAADFPPDVLQVLLGGDAVILGLDETEINAFVIADSALQNNIQSQLKKPCLVI